MPTSASQKPPAYSARPPKDGLLLGDRISRGNQDFIRVSAASDPLVGNALMAVFVPVVKDDSNDRYVPGGKDGTASRLDDVGWLQAFEAPSAERRPLAVPVARLQGQFAGVLVALLYNRTPIRGGDNFPAQVTRFMTRAMTASGDIAERFKQPTPLPDLPQEIADAVRAAITELLNQRAALLRPALIELHA